ncbi:VQ motif-containing protein [Cucumis melo var. makuwa]|uniref:VQ motif-containing protein n=1 Tax=Cucumis melo var. makuwa TaxID=1194695 RepID=A0A5A7VDH6_CUCMM|nr:VQ motif-containing protein [Cucumis melo var. makuwa]TYJ97906.1 VQ motif-containing protein [Cucumis melo var. makuwa]
MENLITTLPTDFHHRKVSQNSNKPTTIDQQNKPIKVKYISSPMMVKANNESEFRAIVQKLTGQHSPDHDANFDQSVQDFNHAFYPPPPSSSTPGVSFDPRDCYGSASGDVLFDDRIEDGDEGRYWRGEMEGSFSGFQASSCVNIW